MLREIQNAIGNIVIDPSVFSEFKADKLACLDQLGLSNDVARVLSDLCPERIEIFREIIAGTRAERFRNVFASFAEEIGSERFSELVREFHACNVVYSNENNNDVYLFEKYARKTLGNDFRHELIEHDLKMFRLKTGEQSLQHPWLGLAKPTAIACYFSEAMARILKIETASRPLYCLYILEDMTNTVEIFEINEDYWSILANISGATDAQDHAVKSGMRRELVLSILSVMTDAGVVAT